MASAATTLGLLSLVPGVKVGVNPYGPDFGKVSVGRTHFDFFDGVPSTARYTAQMMRAFYLHAEGKPPEVVRGVARQRDVERIPRLGDGRPTRPDRSCQQRGQ